MSDVVVVSEITSAKPILAAAGPSKFTNKNAKRPPKEVIGKPVSQSKGTFFEQKFGIKLMAILLNFIISKRDFMEMDPLLVVHRQSEKYENRTYRVHCSEDIWTVSVKVGNTRSQMRATTC